MTIQPTLFGFPIARTKQCELFDGMGVVSADTCPACARHLVETASGYWTCPAGCIKLQLTDSITGQPGD